MTQREYLDWLNHARAMLVEACGAQLGNVQVVVVYEISRQGIEFTLPAGGPAEAGGEWPAEVVELPETEARSLEQLRKKHRRVLEVLTREPKTAQRIAREAGFPKLNSYVRGALTDLVRWGHVLHGPDGYKKPA